uniref:Poly(A) RNA polymerase mitochondrial-like central palm domain-containing protein n=1 Tax=Aureoumbra lagunensis TaxID=44058 RepID=A0A7S3JRT4_9STRA
MPVTKELEDLALWTYQVYPKASESTSQLARKEMWRWWGNLDARARSEALRTTDSVVIGLASKVARESVPFELEVPRRKSSSNNNIGAAHLSRPSLHHHVQHPRYRPVNCSSNGPEIESSRLALDFQVASCELLSSCKLILDGSALPQSKGAIRDKQLGKSLLSTNGSMESSWRGVEEAPSCVVCLEIGATLQDRILELFDVIARRRAFSVAACPSSVNDTWWRAAWFKAYTFVTPAQYIANLGESLLWRAFWADHEHALQKGAVGSVTHSNVSTLAKSDESILWPEDKSERVKSLGIALRRALHREFAGTTERQKLISALTCLIALGSKGQLTEVPLAAREKDIVLRASIHLELLKLRADAAAQRALETYATPALITDTKMTSSARRKKKKKKNNKKISTKETVLSQSCSLIREERAALRLGRWYRGRRPRRHSEGEIRCLHTSAGVVLLEQLGDKINTSDEDDDGSWKRVSSTTSSFACPTVAHNIQHLRENRGNARCVSQSSSSSIPFPRKPLSVQPKPISVDKRLFTRKTAAPDITSYSDALRGVKLTERRNMIVVGDEPVNDEDACVRDAVTPDNVAENARVRGLTHQASILSSKQTDETLTVWRLVKANLQLRRDRLRLEAEVSRLHMEMATLRGPAMSSGIAPRPPEPKVHQPIISVAADDSGPPVLQPIPPPRLVYVYPPSLPVVSTAPALGIPCQQATPHTIQQQQQQQMSHYDGASDDGRLTIRSDLGLHVGFNKPNTLEAVREGDVLLGQLQTKHNAHSLRRASSRNENSADNSWHAGGTRFVCGADSLEDDNFDEEETLSTQDDPSEHDDPPVTDNGSGPSRQTLVEAGGADGTEYPIGDHEDITTTKPPSLTVDDDPIEDPLLMEDESCSDYDPSSVVAVNPVPVASAVPIPHTEERLNTSQQQLQYKTPICSGSNHHPATRAPWRREVVVEEALFSSSSRLANDIHAFAEQVSRRQRSRESAWRAARERVRDVARALWPRARVEPYGSCVTRLSLADASSDLDLVIRLPRVRLATPAMTPGDLEGRNAVKETWPQELARRLLKEKWVQPDSVQTIGTAFVPIVKLLTVPLGDTNEVVKLDVSFEAPWHRGLDANRLVLKMLDDTPAARPLLLVLKQHTVNRGLCASYTGGLSSYALTLLVARYLHEQPSRPTDPGALLLGFLDFYAHRTYFKINLFLIHQFIFSQALIHVKQVFPLAEDVSLLVLSLAQHLVMLSTIEVPFILIHSTLKILLVLAITLVEIASVSPRFSVPGLKLFLRSRKLYDVNRAQFIEAHHANSDVRLF